MSTFEVEKFYEKMWERDLPELKTKSVFYKHKKTGAEVLVLENDDNNKGFGVAFRTIPDDSTGLPHILEHTVFCGSKKYDTKEPFIYLAKSSLNTYLNASTSDAKTIYPVATQNEKDLHNLMDVYLDTVFFPKLDEKAFKQEGWHYELDKEGNFIYKGVVFNEMKGYAAMSNVLLYHNMLRSLFPDTNYIHDSGGNPRNIPDLTYTQFIEFYKKYYHPTNAKVYIYGNADNSAVLEHLEEYLSQFEMGEKVRVLEPQAPFKEPVRQSLPYSAKDESENNFLTFSWALTGISSPKEVLAMHVLQYALEESTASTLRKRVLNKELAESFYSFGMIHELLQPVFSVGYKGVKNENLEKVEKITVEVLNELSEKVDNNLLESAFNQVDFALRELKVGRYPRALAIFDKALDSWAHDRHPLEMVDIYSVLTELRDEVNSENKYFESLLKKYLLNNPHLSILTHYPDTKFIENMEKAEKERLQKELGNLSEDEKDKLKKEIKEFEEWKQREDDPKELEKIPRLEVADLDKEIVKIPSTFDHYKDVEIMKHDLATSGIVYLDLVFDFAHIKTENLPFLNILGELYTRLGTKNYSSDDISILSDKKIGDYSADMLISNKQGQKDKLVTKFIFSFDFLKENFNFVNDLFIERTLNLDLDNKELIVSTLREMLVGLGEGFKGNSAASFAINRVRGHLDNSYKLMDLTEGIEFYFFIKELLKDFDSKWEDVKQTLSDLNKQIVNKATLQINITCDEEIYGAQKENLFKLIDSLPSFEVKAQNWELKSFDTDEGFVVPSEVNNVAYAIDLNDSEYKLHGAYHTIRKLLNSDLLWQKVRVEGGAYGAVCAFNSTNLIFSLVSYSDPNITSTLDIYESISKYLIDLKSNRSELDSLILGAIGSLDNIVEPEDKGWFAFETYLTNLTDELRQQIRNDILNLKLEDIHEFAKSLSKAKIKSRVVIGSKNKMEEANEKKEISLNIKPLL